MFPPAHRLDEVKEYYFSAKLKEIDALRASGVHVINLGIGSPIDPPHPSVVQALCETALLPSSHGYQSYMGILPLREAMADWYRRYLGVTLDPKREVLPLLGSKVGITHLCMAYLNPGNEALVPNPGYPTYLSSVHLSGAAPVPYHLCEEQGWMPDFSELETLAGSGNVKLMFVNYPHMPTGANIDSAVWQNLIAFAKDFNLILVNDNPYGFVQAGSRQSVLQFSGAQEVAVELNSLSKSHNMAGWRIGMAVGNAEILEQMLRFSSNLDSGMFLGAQKAAVVALGLGEEWYQELTQRYSERQSLAFSILRELGCSFQKEQRGIFAWGRVDQRWKDGYHLSDAILKRAAVFVTPGGIFGSRGEPYVRVSLCAEMATLEQALSRIRSSL